MNKLRFLMPIGIVFMAAGFGAVVMLLWNWLLPVMFGLATINFWQALGLLVLCRILFGSFGGRHGLNRHGMHGRDHIRKKWMKMTPEQRKEFVNKRREHFRRDDFFGRPPDFDPFATDENTPKNND
jgi:hypothetical protein